MGKKKKTSSRKDKQPKIPHIMSECLRWLEMHALTEEGLFRISPPYAQMDELMAKFNKGKKISFDTWNYVDPHLIAGTLKCFIRDLKTPLLVPSLTECWLEASNIENLQNRLHAYRAVLRLMPEGHAMLCKRLFQFLHLLASFSEHNKMTPQNLAIVFAPNLLRPDNFAMSDMTLMNRLVEAFIMHYPTLFEYDASQNAVPVKSINRQASNDVLGAARMKSVDEENEASFRVERANTGAKSGLTIASSSMSAAAAAAPPAGQDSKSASSTKKYLEIGEAPSMKRLSASLDAKMKRASVMIGLNITRSNPYDAWEGIIPELFMSPRDDEVSPPQSPDSAAATAAAAAAAKSRPVGAAKAYVTKKSARTLPTRRPDVQVTRANSKAVAQQLTMEARSSSERMAIRKIMEAQEAMDAQKKEAEMRRQRMQVPVDVDAAALPYAQPLELLVNVPALRTQRRVRFDGKEAVSACTQKLGALLAKDATDVHGGAEAATALFNAALGVYLDNGDAQLRLPDDSPLGACRLRDGDAILIVQEATKNAVADRSAAGGGGRAAVKTKSSLTDIMSRDKPKRAPPSRPLAASSPPVSPRDAAAESAAARRSSLMAGNGRVAFPAAPRREAPESPATSPREKVEAKEAAPSTGTDDTDEVAAPSTRPTRVSSLLRALSDGKLSRTSDSKKKDEAAAVGAGAILNERRCVRCLTEVRHEQRDCKFCGADLYACADCAGRSYSITSIFCRECGVKLSGACIPSQQRLGVNRARAGARGALARPVRQNSGTDASLLPPMSTLPRRLPSFKNDASSARSEDDDGSESGEQETLSVEQLKQLLLDGAVARVQRYLRSLSDDECDRVKNELAVLLKQLM